MGRNFDSSPVLVSVSLKASINRVAVFLYNVELALATPLHYAIVLAILVVSLL